MRLENEDDTMVLDWVYSVDVCVCLHDTTDMSRVLSKNPFFGAKNSVVVQTLTKSFINGIIGILN